MYNQDQSSVLLIKYIQGMRNGKVINISHSGCKSSYIEALSLKTFTDISMFA